MTMGCDLPSTHPSHKIIGLFDILDCSYSGLTNFIMSKDLQDDLGEVTAVERKHQHLHEILQAQILGLADQF